MRTAKNTDGTHIVYTDDDLKVDLSYTCGSESLEQYRVAEKQLAGRHSEGTEKSSLKCVTYWWETTYDIYTTFGSSSQTVTNYMAFLFNNFQLIYSNENIGSKLNQLYIWTTEDGLYNNAPGATTSQNLEAFSENRTEFDADLATLFATSPGGGEAYLDVLCSQGDEKHSYCGDIGGSISAFPTYSLPLLVTAHEVGHNLGSPHTHACSWEGGAIDGCGPTASASYSEGCTGPLPSGGGTIMSYCSLISGIGVDFAHGFGSQPGDLIRSRVNSCITRTCETCADAFEPNQSQDEAAAIAVGTTYTAGLSSEWDNDWYRVETSSTANTTYTLVGPYGAEYDMIVYDSNGTLLASGLGTANSSATETVTLYDQPPGTYFISIVGNSTACYTIAATSSEVVPCETAFEPNDSQSEATIIPIGTTYTAGLSSESDNDWYRVEIASTTNNTYSLIGPDGEEYDMIIYDSAGTLIDSGTTAIISPTETVTISSQPPGTYFIHIYGNSESCYFITVSSSDSVSILCETALIAFEPNESQAEATIIPIGTTYTAGLSSVSDNDWYRVETYSTANNTFNLVGPDGGDYEMSIYNSNGTLLGSTTGILTLNNQAPGTYFIHIYGDSTSCYTIAATSSEVASSCETAFEPNNSQAEATTIAVETTYTAGLSPSEYDYYRVETSSAANNTYSLVSLDVSDLDISITNSEGIQIGSGSGTTASSATETLTLNDQPPGTYFIRVYDIYSVYRNTTSCYTLAVSSEVASSCQTAFEPNDSQDEAATITVGTTYTAGLSSGDDDWYRVETSSTANNTYTLVGPDGAGYGITIYNSDGNVVGYDSDTTVNSATETVTLNDQPPGTYFIFIANSGLIDTCYTIAVTSFEVVSSCETVFEPNNSLAEATVINVGPTHTAGFSSTSDYDYYRVETSSTSNNTYTMVSPDGADYGMVIYNSDGNLVAYDSAATANSATETVTINNQPPGTYFIFIANFGLIDSTLSCYTVTVSSSVCETAFEPNGSLAEAATIAVGTTYAAGLSSGWDEDWYRVETSSTTNNTFSMGGPNGVAYNGVVYSIFIYNSDGSVIGAGSSIDGTTVTLNNQPPGTYFIYIYGTDASCYTITATSSEAASSCETAFEPNESQAQAATIAVETIHTAGLSSASDQDWYRVETSFTANNTYSLVGPDGVSLDMVIYNSEGIQIGSGINTFNSATEAFALYNQPPGTYFIQVFGDSTSCYTITVDSSQNITCGTSYAAFEINETPEYAATIAVGTTYTAAIFTEWDNDWYRVETSNTSNTTFSLVDPDGGANLDMVIYDSEQIQIGSGITNNATETVALYNQPPGTYFIHIFGNSGSCYTITVDSSEVVSSCETAFEPNDSPAEAPLIAVGTTNTAGISPASDYDFYRVETSFTANNTYNMVGPDGADYDMLVYDSYGSPIGSGVIAGSATETITISNQPPGTYFIGIHSIIAGNSASCYTIAVSSETISCETAFEPNDLQAQATTIDFGTTYTAGLSTAWDNDWYRVEISSTTHNTYSLVGPAGADYAMNIFNSDGTYLAWGSGTTSSSATETVTLYNQPSGTYFIEVYGYAFAENTSCYTLTVAPPEAVLCEAAFEPNDDSVAQAVTIAVGTTYTAGLSPAWDNDWYRVQTTSTANNTYSLVGPAGADYDMIIYNSAGTSVGWGSGTTSNDATETLTINNQPPGTYFIVIYGYAFAENASCYTLTVGSSQAPSSCAAALEPNNSQLGALPIAVGTTYTSGLSSAADQDYYRVETYFTANNAYNLVGPDGANYDMVIYNSDWVQIGSGTTAGSATETVTINNQPPGTYFIRIYSNGFTNSASCYTLTVAPSGGSSCGAAFEPNNSLAQAATIAVGTTNTALLSPGEQDWYRVETSVTGNNIYNLVGPGNGVDYDMVIYNSDGVPLGSGTYAGSATEAVTINNQAPGTYFIQIYGSGFANSTSCYTVTVVPSEFLTCETEFEPNNSFAEATAIPVGTTYTAGLSPESDEDYYRVETTFTDNTIYNLVGPNGAEYDIVIYNSDGVPIDSGTTAGSATESVAIINQAPGTYYIRIYGYDVTNTTSCYTFTVVPSDYVTCATNFEPNNSLGEATAIAVGTAHTAGLSPESDEDWYSVETSFTANNTYNLVGPNGADYDMVIYNSGGAPIGSGITAGSATESVMINNQAPGTYFIHIYGNYDYYGGPYSPYSTACYTIGVAQAAMGMMASTNEEGEQTISVYPNPTYDMIYLSGRVAGKLTNQLGQTVKTFNGSEVSLKELQPGIYLLQVEGSANLYKIVKE